MAALKDAIEIKTTPERIFNGLITVFSSQELYTKWHKDHVKCQWIRGKSFEEGSILYAEEYLHGKLHKMKFLSIRFVPNRRIEYRLLFPMSIICPRGQFSVEPRGGGCIFTAALTIRFGCLFSKLAKGTMEAMNNHMKEEGENLKKLLEEG